MKYVKQIILFILFFIILDITIILSGDKIAFIVLLLPISGIIGILMGYLLAPLFLLVYKKIIGRKLLFGLQDRPNPDKFIGTFKAFFPALMATNFALLLLFQPSIMNFPLFKPFFNTPGTIILMFFILCTITMVLAMALFSAAWFIIDAGIVSTNKKKAENRSDPIVVQSVGGWYLTLLKGYAGISVIIGLYTFLVEMYELYGDSMHFSIPIFIIPLPILISLWSLPSIILLDKTYVKRRNYILKYAQKFGIQKEIDVQIMNNTH